MTFQKCSVLMLLALALSLAAGAQQNLDFEQGLARWHIAGKVRVDKSNPYSGLWCARLEKGSIFQRLRVSPLSIVQFDAYLKSSDKGINGYAFLRFYNARHQLLAEYKSTPIDSVSYQKTGCYTEAPPYAAYMEIGITKKSAPGFIYADDFKIDPDADKNKGAHSPQVDLDEYMRPFWNSDTIYNETVLLYSAAGRPATGKLLFRPGHIMSVKSFDLKRTYSEGKDYSIKENVLERLPHSAMSFRADSSFDSGKDLAWFNLQSQWVVVTYTHYDQWGGAVPTFKGKLLPLTTARLYGRKSLRIVAFGMSITRGMNISSYDAVPPYMPTYVSLFARQLRKSYHCPGIKLFNASLPGAAVDWGAQYADKYVSPLRPDLVIIDFGMNDFWRLTPGQYKGYMETMIKKIKSANPNAELILISNMKFDPAYVLAADPYKSFYEGNMEGYSHVLKQMEAAGIINLDMYSISAFLYDQKKAKDCISNPLHPNDYLARWFAQCLSALLIQNK